MLSANIHSTSELMSVAVQAEREAVRRYTRLSKEMREYGNEDAARLFDRMVLEEQKHEQQLLEWVDLEGIELAEHIGPISWEDPWVRTDYDDEAKNPGQSTPYRALALAVHNEERAFHFYAHVAANSENEKVRGFAEILAREELGHAAIMRAMRRRAYQEERAARQVLPQVDPRQIHSVADLFAVAASMEDHLAHCLSAAGNDFPRLNKLADSSLRTAAQYKRALDEIGLPSANISNAVKSLEVFYAEEETATDGEKAVKLLCSNCDNAFAFYDTVVAESKNEELMLVAQKLTESALNLMEKIRSTTGDACNPPARH